MLPVPFTPLTPEPSCARPLQLGHDLLAPENVAALTQALLSEANVARLWEGKESVLDALGALAKAAPGVCVGRPGGGSHTFSHFHLPATSTTSTTSTTFHLPSQHMPHTARAGALATATTGGHAALVAAALAAAGRRKTTYRLGATHLTFYALHTGRGVPAEGGRHRAVCHNPCDEWVA